jgi:hypothetical protein
MIISLVKSQKELFPVIPRLDRGTQEYQALLDPVFQRGDDFDDFLKS